MAYAEVVVLAKEPRSGEGVSPTQTNFGTVQEVAMYVDVEDSTASSIHVALEDSPDGVEWYPVTNWNSPANGNHSVRVDHGTSDNVRVRYRIQNGSATLGVTLVSV